MEEKTKEKPTLQYIRTGGTGSYSRPDDVATRALLSGAVPAFAMDDYYTIREHKKNAAIRLMELDSSTHSYRSYHRINKAVLKNLGGRQTWSQDVVALPSAGGTVDTKYFSGRFPARFLYAFAAKK